MKHVHRIKFDLAYSVQKCKYKYIRTLTEIYIKRIVLSVAANLMIMF